MKRNYVNVAKFLESAFTDITVIEGDNYPPPPFVQLLESILWILQLVGLLYLVMGGESWFKLVYKLLGKTLPTDRMGRPIYPPMYYWIQEHRIQLGMGVFLLGPQMLSKFTVTGAFEIYANADKADNNEGVVVWSKLQTGKFPTEQELIAKMMQAGFTYARQQQTQTQ